MLSRISHDLQKAENGNKAAAQRVRTTTVRFEKLAKTYRKESIHNEKTGTKGGKKTAKKSAKPKATKAARPATARVKAKSKAKAVARPRSLAFKKPTAKLPVRRK